METPTTSTQPPGQWRVFAPALLLWAGLVGVQVSGVSGVWLVAAGLILGGVTLGRSWIPCGRATRSPEGDAWRGA